MSASTPEFFVETIKEFYNDPNHSDATLTVNDTKYHLLLPLVKKCAPLLFKEFEEVHKTSETPASLPEQALANLIAALIKSQKKTLSISDATITNDVVNVVLESMYGKSVVITLDNLMVVYKLSTRFGMTYLSDQCLEMFKKTINVETLVGNYQKALEEKSPFENLLKVQLVNNLDIVPKTHLLEFTSKLNYDTVKELVSAPDRFCMEDLIYEIIDGWYKSHTGEQLYTEPYELISLVKLERLSVEMLTTQVKYNPLISNTSYTRALELIVKSAVKNHKHSNLSNDHGHNLVFGKLNGTYQGYRLIINDEVLTEKFRSLFAREYIYFEGLYCIDDIDKGYVCTRLNNLAWGNGCMYTNKPGIKGSIMKLESARDINLLAKTMCTSHYSSNMKNDTIGLFVVDSITF